MIEERCLQVERLEEPEERTNAEFRGLQEDITEVTEIPEEAKCRNYQSRCLLKSRIARGLTVAIAVLLLIVLVLFGLLVYRPPKKESQQQFPDVDIPAPCGPACPSGWIGYKRKCYFFSDEGRNWTSSQNFCASYGSSLAMIENEPEKVFIVRYKCRADYWIGLWKEPGQTWKWADGTELSSTLEVKGEGGNCAFLDSAYAVSSRCYIQRKWICSHHDACARNKNSSIESGKP